MGTYVIGSGGDYATITAAEAALTLPEVGGTIYEITGTVVESPTLSNTNYSNGLTIRNATGEEADGALGGATLNGDITSGISGGSFDITAINFRSLNTVSGAGGGAVSNCDIGNGATTDVVTFSTTETRSFTNCIVRSGSDDGFYANAENTNVTVDQCTVVDCTRFGLLRSVATDTLIIGSGTTDFHSSASATSDYLASSDTSATTEAATTGFNSRTTADLNDYAGGDYNLASGSSLNTSGTGGIRIGANLATTTGLTLDSTPTDINSQTQESSVVSNPATAPTTGNTEVKFDDDLGSAATIDSVTGSDPYTLNYTFPRATAKLFSATGYPVYHEVDAEDVTSGNVPYLPVAGQTYTDLSSPVNTAGTLGETYSGSPAATGDQWVYDTNLTGDASITLTVDAQGYWILSGTPSAPSTASFYRIDSTGTVDVEDTIAFNTGPAVEAPIGTIANSQTLHPITTVVDAAPPSVVATLGTIFNPQFVYPISTLADPDTTPPVISLPTGSANGAYGATGSVTTDEDNGTIYYTATTNVSELAATIIAAGPNRFVNASGLYDVTLTGLTPETTYYMHYVHVDSAGNQSNVVSSSSFLTGEASGIPPLYRRSVNKIADYLRSTQAFSSSQTNQVVVEWLIGEGIARSNLNQMLYTYLGGLGYAGTLQDRMIAWSRDS